jgi:hypothetical protein
VYLDLLGDPYWRVSALDAILAWSVAMCLTTGLWLTVCRLQDETARVEDVLLGKSAADNLVQCFVLASGVSFEGILDP